MKVVRNTPDTLIIEDAPWLMSVLTAVFAVCFGLAGIALLLSGEWATGLGFITFSAFAALFFALFVQRVQLILSRLENSVTLRKKNLWRYRQVVHELSNLDRALAEGGETRRCVLVISQGMSEGRHPVTDYLTSGDAPLKITDAINTWLNTARALDSRGQEP